jgi:hypothetical protein
MTDLTQEVTADMGGYPLPEKDNTFDSVEKTVIEKDENGNDVEIVVKEYPNIPVVVVEEEGE